MPKIDESNISVAELKRILPEDVLGEVAQNLINDIMKSAPPFHTTGGNDLYTLGSHTVHGGGDNFIYLQVTVPEEFGKGRATDIVEMDLDIDLENSIEELGFNKEEMIEKITLFILANINGESDMHNYSCALRDNIGEYAFDKGEGETDSSEILDAMESNIDYLIKNAESQTEIYHLRGLKIHIKSTITDRVSDINDAVELHNEVMNELKHDYNSAIDLRTGYGYDGAETDANVVNKVFEWLVNPLEYINQNQDMRFNLIQYESQYGKLPRQPELPGIEAKRLVR